MKIAINTMELHEKRAKNTVGSSRIRGNWLLNYWEEAELFQIGKKYDVVIFQKAYDLAYMRAFDGIKIFDLCDPDWLEKKPIKEVTELCDAVVTSTPALAEFVRNITNKPVLCIPDRMDLNEHAGKREHTAPAKMVGWFGYHTNQKTVDQCLSAIKRLGLKLTVFSDLPYQPEAQVQGIDDLWLSTNVRNIKYDYETINQEMLSSVDIIINPRIESGRFKYKSNNKTLTAWALGIPVAETADDLEMFMDPDKRQAESDKRVAEIKEKWDVKQSVEDYKQLIHNLCKLRSE